jgi:hypothetical protein
MPNKQLTEQMNDRLFDCRWTAKGREHEFEHYQTDIRLSPMTPDAR